MRTLMAICALCVVRGVALGQQTDDPSTYDLVVAGSKCSQAQMPYQNSAQLSCVYTVGTGLKFEIAGIGQDDAAILVLKANGLDADFYFKFGLLHGCVIVTRGFAKQSNSSKKLPGFDMAFVSPKTGRVYKTWQDCGGLAG